MTKQKYQAHTTDYDSYMDYLSRDTVTINAAHVEALFMDTVILELAHREALAEDAKRNFCTDFQKKAAALPAPNLESAFAKEVGAFLDELTNKGE